jgi:hypothetical protein
VFSVLAFTFVASLPVESIRIESRWAGLGEPRATTYLIERHGNFYERMSATIPQDAVDRFVSAVTAAPVDRGTAIRGLATREWLTARASEPHNNVAVPVCSAEAVRLLGQHLADPEEAVRALDGYFSERWTDDYPSMSIDIAFDDRRTIHLESHAQPALL